MNKFFDDSDLEDVFAQFNANIESNSEADSDDDREMEASQRRYEEIIKKNQN